MPMSNGDLRGKVIGKIRGAFEVVERHSGHLYYDIYYGGKVVVTTYQSNTSPGKDIPDSILGKIKRQLRLNSSQQLHDLKNCPMSAEDYLNLLKSKGII